MKPDEEWYEQQHREAMERSEPGYIDLHSHLFVLTAESLADQAECCGQGCRHCPWPEEEQRRAGRPSS